MATRRSSIKDPKMYEKLRDEGNSKEKSARISNAAAKTSRSQVGKKGGHAGPLDQRTKTELYARAKELGIDGRSRMSKSDLIQAIRNH